MNNTETIKKIEKKLLDLMKIQLDVVESLYKDVHEHIKTASTSSNKVKIIKNVPVLKMNINGSRQKVVIQLKANIRELQIQLEKKYGKES
jgi:hypothetical protein